MLRLFSNGASGNCYKVRLLLSHLDRPCSIEEISVLGSKQTRPAEFLANTPTGRVPALVLEDGTWLFESGAILCHLAAGTAYLPADGIARSRVLQWMFFEQNLLEPSIASRRYWVHLAPDPAPRAAQLDPWLDAGHETLAVMERHLQHNEFFAGAYSIADIALYGHAHVAPEGGFSLEGYPSVRAWIERVAAQPGYVPMQGDASRR